MSNSQRLAEVRERLCDWLAQQAGQPRSDHANAMISGESILIIGGFYCGRRFDAGNHYAIWFIEEDELKIHAAGGELLCVLAGDELSQPIKSEVSISEAVTAEQEPEVENVADVISLPDLDPPKPDDDVRRAA